MEGISFWQFRLFDWVYFSVSVFCDQRGEERFPGTVKAAQRLIFHSRSNVWEWRRFSHVHEWERRRPLVFGRTAIDILYEGKRMSLRLIWVIPVTPECADLVYFGFLIPKCCWAFWKSGHWDFPNAQAHRTEFWKIHITHFEKFSFQVEPCEDCT